MIIHIQMSYLLEFRNSSTWIEPNSSGMNFSPVISSVLNRIHLTFVVYDLLTNSFEEVDYVIKTLKTAKLLEEKRLVLLSTIMTWVNTPPKYKKELEEGEEVAEGEEEEEPEEEEEEEPEEGQAEGEEEVGEDGEPIKKPKPIFYKESDRHLRVPDPAY